MTSRGVVDPSLENPFDERAPSAAGPDAAAPADVALPPYDEALRQAEELRRRPYVAAGVMATLRQHARDRMTVWERVGALQDRGAQPTVLWQNWGKNLDGASSNTN